MKHFKIITLILFINSAQECFTQEIYWDNISLGATVQYIVPKNDFGEHWHPAFGGGLYSRYEANELFSLIGAASFASFKVIEEKNNIKAPDVSVLNITAGLKFYQTFITPLSGFIGFGIDNHTFIFYGENAKVLGSNNIESEFGLFLIIGASYDFKSFTEIELTFKVERIFTDPLQISIHKFGMNIYL